VARLFITVDRNMSGNTNNPVASAKLEPSGLLEPLAGAAHVNSTFTTPTEQFERRTLRC
jgi:hypothetical protein